MAKRRMIDPSIWNDPDVGELSGDEFKLFVGLFSNADDEGRIELDCRQLKHLIFGYCDRATSVDVAGWLFEICERLHSVTRYKVGGKEYLAFLNWKEYQNIPKDKFVASKLPAPPDAECVPDGTSNKEGGIPSDTDRQPEGYRGDTEGIPSGNADKIRLKENRVVLPPIAPLPPQVQADIALRDYLVGKAEGLMSKGVLTRAARDTLKGWFTQHKQGMTAEMVDYAVSQTAMHTPGDALAYFCEVIERQLSSGPGSNRAKNGAGKSREMPGPGYSWDRYPDGSFKPHARDPVTGLYPYDFDNLDDVLERDKDELAVHLAGKQGLKVAITHDGRRLPVRANGKMAGAA